MIPRFPRGPSGLAGLALLVGYCLPASQAWGQLPGSQLLSVFPPGARAGCTVEIGINGTDLDEVSRLLFSHPGIRAEAKVDLPGPLDAGPRPVPGYFLVTVEDDVPPGLYEVRGVGRFGVSNPRVFVVGDNPEMMETEPNNAVDAAMEVPVETLINGRANGESDIDYFRFRVCRGSRWLVVCEAEPLLSRMDATLTLYDPSGREVASSRDYLGRDPLIDFVATEDGLYVVAVHDAIFGGGAEYAYRLTVTSRPTVDFVFPSAVAAGQKSRLRAYGRLFPGANTDSGTTLDGGHLDVRDVEVVVPDLGAAVAFPMIGRRTAGAFADVFPFVPSPAQRGARPVPLGVASASVVEESEPNDDFSQAAEVEIPCEIQGQFATRGDKDWYVLSGRRGDSLWIEILSERLGWPTDPVLVLQRIVEKDGRPALEMISEADDMESTSGLPEFDVSTRDGTIRFDIPEDGRYALMARNASSAGDPRFVYRLRIEGEAPDFRLAVMPRHPVPQPNDNNSTVPVCQPLLRKGGTAALHVVARRLGGFGGQIRIDVDGLPAGVRADRVVIPPGRNYVVVPLVAEVDAPFGCRPLRVEGVAAIGDVEVCREARPCSLLWPCQPRNRDQSRPVVRLTGPIFAGVLAEDAPFLVEPGAEAPAMVSRGGKFSISLKVRRGPGFENEVQVEPLDLPPGCTAKAITIPRNKDEGILELDVDREAPILRCQFTVVGRATVPYRRNPEAAERAKARQSALEETTQLLKDARTRLETASKEAESESMEAAASVQRIEQSIQEAKASLARLQGRLNAGAPLLSLAEQSLAKAEAMLAATRTRQQAATDSKASADQALAQIDETLQAAEQSLAAVRKEAEEAANAAAPRDVAVAFPSPAIPLRIFPVPVKWTIQPEFCRVRPGESLAIRVSLARLPGFADAVSLTIKPPQGTTAWGESKLTIPPEANSGEIELAIPEQATAGEYSVSATLSLQFNGQELREERPVRLVLGRD